MLKQSVLCRLTISSQYLKSTKTQIRFYSSDKKHFNVAVIGGGCAGLAVSHKITKTKPSVSLAIFEPKTEHYYQPGSPATVFLNSSKGGLLLEEEFLKIKMLQKEMKQILYQQRPNGYNKL